MAAISRKTRTSPVTTIFFDLDNTLIETRNGDKLACEKVSYLLVQQYGIPQDVASQVTQTFLRNFRKCPENLDYPLDEWRRRLWENALGFSNAHLAGEIYTQWLDLRYTCQELTPEIISLLQQLRQTYLVAMITNGPSRSQWEKIVKLKLRNYFDCILVSGDLPYEKPDENIFQHACLQLGVAPENCIMVGDKLETDILGAIKASLGGNVWVPLKGSNRNFVTNIKPDYILDHVTELSYLLPFKKRSAPVHPRLLDVEMEDCNSNCSDGS